MNLWDSQERYGIDRYTLDAVSYSQDDQSVMGLHNGRVLLDIEGSGLGCVQPLRQSDNGSRPAKWEGVLVLDKCR